MKALERKRKQAENRAKRKVEKEDKPKKKARATKGAKPEPFDTGVQERPSEPSSECRIELPSSSRQPIEAPT